MPPTDDVPNMLNVNEESFFHRDLQIPKNIQAHQDGTGTPSAGQSVELEGEIPVTFYDYLLSSGIFNYAVLPLQRLYENHGQAMAPKEFPPINPPSPPRHGATGERDRDPLPVEQPLRIMEFPTCYYAKDFLEAFSSEHIWNLQNRGGGLRPGVSFRPLGSQRFTIAISIPYLGVEENIRPPAPTQEHGASSGQDRLGLEVLERLKELTDFRRDRPLSWPRESLTLAQNRCPNVDYSNLLGNSAGKDFILVHRAGTILLNTTCTTSGGDDGSGKETLAIFRSCDDKNSGRVPLLPHQKSTNALDAFLNVLSNTLKSSERVVLDNLRSKASNYWSDFQEFVRKPDTPKDFGDRMISDSATLSGELSAVIDVARSQKRYIKDLQEFLARLGPGPNHPNGSLQLSSQPSERGNMILTKINFILEERQTFLDEVNEIFLEVKAIEKSFYQLSTLRASQRLCEETVYEMKRQGRKSRKAWWKRIIPLQEKAPTRGGTT